MRRLLIPFCVLFLLAALALIPITKVYKLNINSSYYNVYQNLATAQNWARWYSSLKENRSAVTGSNANGFNIKSHSTEVTLQKIGLGAFNINIPRGKGVGSYDCIVVTNDNISTTNVVISRRLKLYSYLWSILHNQKEEIFIYSLKRYLEDTQRYYGYLIKSQVINEKLMIVKQQTCFSDNLCRDNRIMMQQLHDLSSEAKLSVIGPVQLQYLSLGKDSTEVIIGLPVKEKQGTLANIQYMVAPGGKVLIGYFKGKYKDRQKLYAAMSLYLTDHYLQAQTKPLEKFENNRLPTDDESMVQLQLIIPFV